MGLFSRSKPAAPAPPTPAAAAVESRMAAEGGTTPGERIRWAQGQIDLAWAKRHGTMAANGMTAPRPDPLLEMIVAFSSGLLVQLGTDRTSPLADAAVEVSSAARNAVVSPGLQRETELRQAVAGLREAVAALPD